MSNFGVGDSFFESACDSVREKYLVAQSAPDIAPTSWQVGRLESKGRAPYPLVAFIRAGGTVEPTQHPGRREYIYEGTTYYFVAHYDDVATVQAMIAAKNWLELERVRSSLIYAVREALGTEAQPGSYRHLTEEEGASLPIASAGLQSMVQEFTWRLPIPHEFGQLTLVQAIDGSSRFYAGTGEDSYTAGPSTTQTA